MAGTAVSVTVQALDADNGPAPSYRGTVHLVSSDSQAQLPGDYSFTAADNGVHTFTATLSTAGPQSITITDTAVSFITGIGNVVVNPAAAVQFQIIAPPSSPSGAAFDITVIAMDPYGNTDVNYSGTITFTSSDTDPNVVLPADYAFTASDGGMHVFPVGVVLITPGAQTITVTDTTSGITGTVTVTIY